MEHLLGGVPCVVGSFLRPPSLPGDFLPKSLVRLLDRLACADQCLLCSLGLLRDLFAKGVVLLLDGVAGAIGCFLRPLGLLRGHLADVVACFGDPRGCPVDPLRDAILDVGGHLLGLLPEVGQCFH